VETSASYVISIDEENGIFLSRTTKEVGNKHATKNKMRMINNE
jgi:hypothetical protein